jgi:hypothetical protein
VQVKAWVVETWPLSAVAGRGLCGEVYVRMAACHNLPGNESHTPARWKKLNDAFGEGWEADFTSRRLPRLPV